MAGKKSTAQTHGNAEKASSYAGYVIRRGYRCASVSFYSSATKQYVGTLSLAPARSANRRERYRVIAEFLKNIPAIGSAPDYKPTKKKEEDNEVHE